MTVGYEDAVRIKVMKLDGARSCRGMRMSGPFGDLAADLYAVAE